MSSKSSPAFTVPFLSHPTEKTAWYLATAPLADGVFISRDRARMFDAWDADLAEPEYGFDASDYPTYAAATQYERDPTGKFKQVATIYFVVDDCDEIFFDAYVSSLFRDGRPNLAFSKPSITAVQKLNALPDPYAAMFVTAEKEEAERRVRQ
ncbi:hypothetical protein C8R43DRAFT_961686 [Mycena crocata]|nr:hypothetical protein C8R43DRAFT_961686 [Mycena crocata]